nr:hypothetical protein GCM10020092_022500 [Actinoplanes digitatis]
MTDNPAVLTVVGIGADGWPGLTGTATAALTGAEVIFGSSRQLALLPESVAAELHPWPTPLVPALRGLLESRRGRRIAVLASGDPMFHGIGATLIRLVGAASVRVIPSPSSVSLAAARLGWPLPDVDVLSLVSAPVEELHPLIHPGRKILILSAGARTPAAVAALLTSRGYADSVVTVLSQLGGPAEELIAGTAANLGSADFDPLNVVAVVCSTGADVSTRPSRPAAPWAGSPKSSGTDAGHSAGGHSAGGHSAGGRMDGGQADGGHADARHLESGHADVGCLDGGHADGGHPDFAHADDGHADGGRSADGLSDGRNLDVSHADGGRQDAGHF